MIFRSHRSQAIAHASVGMTWLLNSAAATDASRRTCPCWHDMAAGTSPKDDLLSKLPQQPSQITCPSSRPLSNPILLKAKSFLPKSLSDAPR